MAPNRGPQDLVELAIPHLPTGIRIEAQQVVTLAAAGFKTQEIATMMGINWHQVTTLREQLGDAVISAMRDQGYSEPEVVRTLGIPSQRLAGT